MQIYLVGGAVRDELLHIPVTERDWVVVGSSPEEMVRLGYQPVGKEFPVFLHPETREEYALARTERKVGKGYKGFVFYTDPSITLEEDLKRRDLTINAIAKSIHNDIIDPYQGQKDLHAKILRHVSSAFAEDPVRILRTARFSAKFPDFSVNAETNALMQDMVKNGEVNALVAERVWQELKKALDAPATHRFFTVLDQCGALAALFPSLQNRPIIENTAFNSVQKFCVLFHATRPDDFKALCQRYKIPHEYSDLTKLTHELLNDYKHLTLKNPKELLQIIKRGDALRRAERFQRLVEVLHDITSIDHTKFLMTALQSLKDIDTYDLQQSDLTPQEFAAQLEQLQLQALTRLL